MPDGFDAEELEELRAEARELGWNEDRYIQMLKSLARPHSDTESIARARQRVLELIKSDQASDPTPQGGPTPRQSKRRRKK